MENLRFTRLNLRFGKGSLSFTNERLSFTRDVLSFTKENFVKEKLRPDDSFYYITCLYAIPILINLAANPIGGGLCGPHPIGATLHPPSASSDFIQKGLCLTP